MTTATIKNQESAEERSHVHFALLTKTWFGHNGSVRRERGGSSGIARSVLSREASAVSVYMLRQWLRRETSVWLT